MAMVGQRVFGGGGSGASTISAFPLVRNIALFIFFSDL